MAHPNIDERRAYVKKLLESNTTIDYKKMVEISEQFNCTHSAIRADVYALKRDTLLATPHVSARMRQLIRERDNRTCQYCGVNGSEDEFIIEHVIPAVIGGVAKSYNLVVACQSCNSRKKSKVWIPRNLDSITKAHLEWKDKVLNLADPQQPMHPF
jgi:hypothetical protein